MFTAKPDPDCEECEGDGYYELKTTVSDVFKKVKCGCTYEHDDEEGLDDYMLEHKND